MPSASRRVSRIATLAALAILPALTACEPASPGQSQRPEAQKPDAQKPDAQNPDAQKPEENTNKALQERKSELPRAQAKKPPAELEGAMQREQLNLGLDLLRASAKEKPESNTSLSPYSVHAALATLIPVAQENTLKELAQTLGGSDSPEQVLQAMSYFDQELQSRNSEDENDEWAVIFSSANRIFLNSDLQPSKEGLDALAQSFGTGVFQTDFAQQPQAAREGINHWIEKQTRGLIKDLYSEDQITANTQWILSNALYLKAPWNLSFSKPSPKPFTLLNGEKVDVPTLHSTERTIDFGQSESLDWAELPFEGGDLSLMLLLPKAEKFQEVQESLSADLIGTLLEKKQSGRVEISFPTYSVNTSLGGIQEMLKARGLNDLFGPEMDLGKLLGAQSEQSLDALGSINQTVTLEISEWGIEAAAVTDGKAGAEPDDKGPDFKLFVDRPFFFLVRDIPTGQTLFTGRVLDPRQK